MLGWTTSQALPFVTTPDPSTYPIHWYKLKIAGYYLYANYTELDATESSSSSDEYLWCFLQSNTGRIVIYNKAIGKCMSNGWEFTPYLFSQSTNYVEVGSGNNFYICSNAYGSKSYMQCDYGQISFSPSSGDPITAIQALVEDYIEPTGTLVFPDPTVYDDHCTIEFDYHPGEADSGCELRLYVNGTWVSMPYWIQRTNEVQTVEATAKVIFSNPRIRTIEVTKTFEIPALDDAPQPVDELTFTPYAFNIPHNELSNSGDEGYAKLFDKNRNTKWCVVNSTGAWETISVDFKSNVPFTPSAYTMTTGNDTHSYTGRNPKKWKIYAKAKESDSWVTIVNITDGTAAGLGTNNTTDYDFTINGLSAKYQFFRFEVSEICGSDGWNSNNYVFQLAELALSGNIPDVVPGDVNGDGIVTAADVTALYDYLLNNDTTHVVNGDQSGDGVITAADVTAVYDILLGN